MHQCLGRLLAQSDDEESLEALCRLLSTIGKELEAPPQQTGQGRPTPNVQRDAMNGYFGQLEDIIRKGKISNRIRFMIQDVIDLRRSHWKPRREDNNPKTIDQIHKDAEREREEQEKELMNAPSFQGPMGSMGSSRPGDRRDDRNRKQSRPGDDGWNTVSTSNRSNVKLDMKQLRIPKLSNQSDTDQMLGPGGLGRPSWGRGAGVAMATPSPGNAPSSDGRSNRYQLLEDDSGVQGGSGAENKTPFHGRSSFGGHTSGRGHQEYRPMAGATKSALYAPKDSERDRSLDASRSHKPGPMGLSRSQQSSRENSVTRPAVREPVQQPILIREASKELLLGKSTATEDEIERKAHSILGEFFLNEKLEDVVIDVKESLHSSNVAKFINFCLLHVLENDRVQRKATGAIFKELLKRRFIRSDDMQEGLTELLQSAEDFIVDIPKLWEYVAELVEPIFNDGVVPLVFMKPLSSLVDSSLVPNFIAATLKELVKTQGSEAAVEKIFLASNLRLSGLLPDELTQPRSLVSINFNFC